MFNNFIAPQNTLVSIAMKYYLILHTIRSTSNYS